jgi:hypothetical protein
MAKADFDLQLLDGTPQGSYKLFQPGQILRGEVTIFTDEDVKCQGIFTRLLWHTQGRGSIYKEQVAEKELYRGTLKAGFPNSYTFVLDLPRDPWSYEGHYVSVVWLVQIYISVPWGRDIRHDQPFILRPQPKPIEP